MAEELENQNMQDVANEQMNQQMMPQQDQANQQEQSVEQKVFNLDNTQNEPVDPNVTSTLGAAQLMNNLNTSFPALPVDNKFDIPAPQVQENVVGLPDQPPGPYAVKTQGDALVQMLRDQSERTSRTENKDFGMFYNYDNGPDGNAFYKRYAALVGTSDSLFGGKTFDNKTFDQIGFSPLRNNEANFNAHTTGWNDWGRMYRHSFPVLFKRGFVDGPKSMIKAFSGDFRGADLADAKEYEEAAAIGMSSKDGVGPWFNNTVMNFGYTAGIILEAIAEEFALSAMTLGSGGLGAGVQASRTAQLIKGIGKGLGKFGSGGKAVKDLLKATSTVPGARGLFNGVKKTGKFFNPLENTTSTISALYKGSNGGKYVTGIAAMSKTAGALYRDMRALNMAVSESRLEAGMVENKVFDKLYKKHYKDFGVRPTAKQQADMREQAKVASLSTFNSNAPIIYLTNRLTFRNVVSPKGGLRNFIKNTREDIYKIGATAGERNFGTLGKVIYNNSKKAFEFEANNLKGLAKSWWKNPGYKTAAKTLGYFKSNFSEGFQENFQEIVARSTEKYYTEAFETNVVSSSLYANAVNDMTFKIQTGSVPTNVYRDEIKNELSAEGFKTFASGFAMGMFSAPLNQAIPFLSTQYNRIYHKDEYVKWKRDKLKITKELAKDLNNINTGDLLNQRLMNVGMQDIIADIYKNGSKKEALDAELEGFVKTVSVMSKTGTFGVFIDKLEEMKTQTDEELIDDVGSSDIKEAPKYRERIDRTIARLKSIDENLKTAREKLENPVTDEMIETAADNKEKESLKTLQSAWNKSVTNFVFFNESFKDTLQRMNSIQTNYLKGDLLSDVDYAASKVIFEPTKRIKGQINILKSEIEIEENKDDTNKTKVRDLKNQIKYLEEYEKAYTEFNKFYNRGPLVAAAVKSLKESGVKEPTEEQIEKEVNKKVGKIDDEKKQVLILGNLKKAHDEYIKSLATDAAVPMLQENLDKAFNELLDFYKLGEESSMMANYINILHDPGEFLKLVTETQKAQEEAQAKMESLIKNLIDKQVKNVEHNQLLNTLASHAPPLFFAEGQFIDFYNNGIEPTHFLGIDGERYEKGSPEYGSGLALVKKQLELNKIKLSNVDTAKNIEMTPEMKKSVEMIKAVFADSMDIISSQGVYKFQGVDFERVSNIVNSIYGDYGYQDINNRLFGVEFNESFSDPVFNEKLQRQVNRVDESGNEIFNFNEATINSYIDKLAAANLPGFNTATINNLRSELLSLAEGNILNSNQKEIDKLTKLKENEQSQFRKENLDREIKKLQEESTITEDLNLERVKQVITDIIPRITYESGRQRGDTLDALVRDFFDASITDFTYDSTKITKEAFETLFGENGFLTKLKEAESRGDIYVFSKNLTLADNNLSDKDGNLLPPAAGSLDLVIVDKSGKVYIADLKTGSLNKWNSYQVASPGTKQQYNYKKYFQNSMQQRAYANLLYNKSNGMIDAETLILPVQTKEDPETGKVTLASKPEQGDLVAIPEILEEEMFIYADKDLKYIDEDNNLYMVLQIDKKIPRIDKGTDQKEMNDEEVLNDAIKELQSELEELRKDETPSQKRINEVELELKQTRSILAESKLTPEQKAKRDADAERTAYNKAVTKRKNKAFKEIKETKLIISDRNSSGYKTTYTDSNGEVYILNEIILPQKDKETGKYKPITEADKQRAYKKIQRRILNLADFDKSDYKRQAKVDNTIDNITGRTFPFFVGKDALGNPYEHNLTVLSVYVMDDGNYRIRAKNNVNQNGYDMVVTPDGDVVKHFREGRFSPSENEIIFSADSFARQKTEAEKEEEKDSVTDKRADIEKRREISLIVVDQLSEEEVKELDKYDEIEAAMPIAGDSETGYEAYYYPNINEEVYSTDDLSEEDSKDINKVKAWVNAKYDAELAALEAKGKPVAEPESYKNAVEEYKKTDLGGGTEAQIAKDNLIKEAKTKEGKAFVEDQVDRLEKNDDGTITVYRAGTIQEGNIPVTTSKQTAELIAEERKGQGLSSEIQEFKVMPSDVAAVVPGIESELLININTGNINRISNTANKQEKALEELLSEKEQIQNELSKVEADLAKTKKDKSEGTFPFADSIYNKAVKDKTTKIKNLKYQIVKLDKQIAALDKNKIDSTDYVASIENMQDTGVYDNLFDTYQALDRDKVNLKPSEYNMYKSQLDDLATLAFNLTESEKIDSFKKYDVVNVLQDKNGKPYLSSGDQFRVVNANVKDNTITVKKAGKGNNKTKTITLDGYKKAIQVSDPGTGDRSSSEIDNNKESKTKFEDYIADKENLDKLDGQNNQPEDYNDDSIFKC